MIDETGKKVWEETFDLWGKPHDRLETRVVGGAILTNVKPREANKNQAISQPFRFPGQYHDEETGLYYNRYRYYMPNEGMYTQRDPIGLAGGNPTVYGYCFDTLKEVDPFGLNCSGGKPKNNNSNNELRDISENPVSTQNKGSTGRTVPQNLYEQIAMNATKNNPFGSGESIRVIDSISDSRWQGWEKWQNLFRTNSNGNINIHFNFDPVRGLFDDFKFK